MSHQHRIEIEQNKPERIELLRAQRLFYARAKKYQYFFAIVALVLPAIGVLFGSQFPGIRPFLVSASILALVLEVMWFSPRQREYSKCGAKVQEIFDTQVLMLSWNKLVAGDKVDAEAIRAITSMPMSDAERDGLLNWYTLPSTCLPVQLVRLLCQRINATYDHRVRSGYINVLRTASYLLPVVLVVAGLLQGLKVEELLLTLCLPALPLEAYLVRECRKQQEALETLSTIKSEIEKTWEKALGGASNEELTVSARALQDAIYRHRVSNALVPDVLYNAFRDTNEALAQHGVDVLVREAEQKLDLPREVA